MSVEMRSHTANLIACPKGHYYQKQKDLYSFIKVQETHITPFKSMNLMPVLFLTGKGTEEMR